MGAYTAFAFLLVSLLGLALLAAKPLGGYIADVMAGRPNAATRLLGPPERSRFPFSRGCR